MIKNAIKHLLKKWFLVFKIRERYSAAVQIGQRNLYIQYQKMASSGKVPALKETGFRVFSQFEEDGLLLFIFSLLGMPYKTFVEFGAEDGLNSNSANLYFNHGWHGLFIDGNKNAIKRGKAYYSKHPHPWLHQPTFVHALVTAENINEIITNAGFSGPIGLLSIDIDGNDYWVWKAIECVDPQVVIIETHIIFGMKNVVVPYNPQYFYPGKHPAYHGASPVAMVNLAKQKGYRLVGANDLGFNFIFVKNTLVPHLLPEVSIESVLTHPSAIAGFKKMEPIQDWEFVSP